MSSYKKLSFYVLLFVLILTLSFGFASCKQKTTPADHSEDQGENENVDVKKVELFDFGTPIKSDAVIELLQGETLKLVGKITATPGSDNATRGEWSSSNSGIVSVSDTGVLTASSGGGGSATITYTSSSDNTKKASVTINVLKNYEKAGCLTFVSKTPFKLHTADDKSHWLEKYFTTPADNTVYEYWYVGCGNCYDEDYFGTWGSNKMEYSITADSNSWAVWNGTEVASSSTPDADGNYYLYVRGQGNYIISSEGYDCGWSFETDDPVGNENLRVECYGDIRTLIDYQNPTSAAIGWDEDMGCFSYMFHNCNALTRAPKLPSTQVVPHCYENMFVGCNNLKDPPVLPADNLEENCYSCMFADSGVEISAKMGSKDTVMAENCCMQMYQGCEDLKYLRALPATTLYSGCYNQMFSACENLTQLPYLPAKNLPGESDSAYGCYSYMFDTCYSIQLQEGTETTDQLPYLWSVNNDSEGTAGEGAFEKMFGHIGSNPGSYEVIVERGKTYLTNCEVVYPENM